MTCRAIARGTFEPHLIGKPAPLEPLYPVVFFDALRLKIRDEA